MEDLSKHILNTIKEKGINPKPRWEFLVRDAVLWAAFSLMLVLGSIAVSVILFTTTNQEWDIYRYINKSLLEYVFTSLPYIWIVFLFGFLAIAHYNFKHTKKGYRYHPIIVVGINILISICLGWLIYTLGFGAKIEESLSSNIPYYKGFAERRMEIWNNPSMGLIGGRIENVQARELTLKDFSGHIWNVDTQHAQWRGRITPQNGLFIKVIGIQEAGQVFKAQEIRPWIKRGGSNTNQRNMFLMMKEN